MAPTHIFLRLSLQLNSTLYENRAMRYSLLLLAVFVASCSNYSEKEWIETPVGGTRFYVSIPPNFYSHHSRKELSFDVVHNNFYASNEEQNQRISIAVTEYPVQSEEESEEFPLSCQVSGTHDVNLALKSEQKIEVLNNKTKMIKCQSEEAHVYIASLFVNDSHFTFSVSDLTEKKNFDIRRFVSSVSYRQM